MDQELAAALLVISAHLHRAHAKLTDAGRPDVARLIHVAGRDVANAIVQLAQSLPAEVSS